MPCCSRAARITPSSLAARASWPPRRRSSFSTSSATAAMSFIGFRGMGELHDSGLAGRAGMTR
ncbi:MAG: hypothetical protein A3I72_14285 [Candidatus Tectomicrobia bacterium RIFCSPLOWO2_02_FULL_70_19]|nr:MAG: hypothetical protein A3I72_14285 [Candidatus Tectomicrobia bacterium RIFCSPLOWO2_02_FULL_70_19]